MNSPDPNPQTLRSHVEFLSALTRHSEDLPSLNKAASYIEKKFSEYGYKVGRQGFKTSGAEYYNLTVLIPGKSRKRLIVGAHYDAVVGTPGADDNASAVAGLLELAGLLRGVTPAVDVELVAFTLEEPPHFATSTMGSAVHARNLKKEKVDVLGMISLEMIGYFLETPDSQGFPVSAMKALYPSTGNFIMIAGNLRTRSLASRIKRAFTKRGEIAAYTIVAPNIIAGMQLSDHRNHAERGWPAVMITDTAFYRNPNYHMSSDLPATLNYDRMAQVVRGTHEFLISLKP